MTRPPDVPPEPFIHSRPSTPAEHPRASLPLPVPRARPVERPPLESTEQAPQRERQANRFSFAVLITAIVVIVAGGGVLGYSLLRRAPASRVATVSPAPPSALAVQPAPPSVITRRPAPSAQPIPEPSVHYVKTPWGTRCQVSADQIICDSCEPGLVLDTPAGANCPGPSLNETGVDASGAKQKPNAGVILPVSPSVQQLSDGSTYEISGWTITVGAWVRFTNNSTGHGMAVAAQNEDFF